MNGEVSNELQNCETSKISYRFLKRPKIAPKPPKQKKNTHYRCYTFQQIKTLTPETVYENKYGRIGGYFIEQGNIFYLSASQKIHTQMIKIILDSNECVKPNSFTEVFGKIYFDNTQAPVLYIKAYFCKEIEGSYEDCIGLYQLFDEIKLMKEESSPLIIDLYKDQQIDQIAKELKNAKEIRTKNLFANMTEIVMIKEVEYEEKHRLLSDLKQMLNDMNESKKSPSIQNLQTFRDFLGGELNDLEVERDYLSTLKEKINSSKNSDVLNAEDKKLSNAELGDIPDDMDFV